MIDILKEKFLRTIGLCLLGLVVCFTKPLCALRRFRLLWFVEMFSIASSGSLASVVFRYVYVGFYA